ncbi:MAG: beta-lactamase family protein [Bacteriovoracaceae bacterium]|nr:beta-lactamase family protein [Bacteriovoracaceae bacterium]
MQLSTLIITVIFFINCQVFAAEVKQNLRNVIFKHIESILDPTGINGAPGIVIGVVTKNKTQINGFGSRYIRRKVQRPDEFTFFCIGSITKLFTGLILADAVVKKQVKLDDLATKYIKADIKSIKGITLRQLVTHYSGLPTFPSNMTAFRDQNQDKRNDSTPASPASNYSMDLFMSFLGSKNQKIHVPGSKFHYSNIGVSILSMALVKHFGRSSFDSLNNAKILNPLNMHDTGLNTPKFLKKTRGRQAQGYMVRGRRVRPIPFPDMGVLASSGELISTGKDLSTLLSCLTGLNSCPLGSAAMELTRPLEVANRGNKIGYAIDIRSLRGGSTFYSKSGMTAGHTAVIMWQTNPKLGIVILANRGKLNAMRLASINLFEAFAKKNLETK